MTGKQSTQIGSSLIRAAAYVRMSSDKQEASIPEQEAAIRQYAPKHGYQIVRWYKDEGISGDDTEKRLGFKQMLHDATHSGGFEVIIVWDQDRCGAGLPHRKRASGRFRSRGRA